MRAAIGWLSIALILGASAFVGYEIWFCSVALHGDLGGCAGSVMRGLASSPLPGAAFVAGVAGLLFAQQRR